MKQDYACGVVIAHRRENQVYFLLVQGYGGYWGFPKGHAEPNETKLETALRELQEETLITDVEIIRGSCFCESYIIRKKRGPHIEKHNTYFLGLVKTDFAVRQYSEIKQLRWCSLVEAKRLVVGKKASILQEANTKVTSLE